MDSRHGRKRLKLKVKCDRLSSLPDDLIHKILSFISLQQAIEIRTLSSRWRYIWTSMPYLNFSTESFSKLNNFSKFVTDVLSRHNNQVQLSSVKLSFHGKATQVFVKRILNYAFSHNVEQLTVVSFARKDVVEFPINLFSSQSLKHLTLTLSKSCTLASTWNLPALTTLCLSHIKLDGDLFSNCQNLKHLTLNRCKTKDESGAPEESHLNICLSKLSNLTLEHVSCIEVNVEAPQLKNLIMRGYSSVNLSADVLSLEKVDLTISYPRNAQAIVGLLQQFRSVKFLTLNLEIVEFLSSSVELISHQPSPFANLKSLKIYPAMKMLHKKSNVSPLVEKYFLDSSPGATFTMVLHEEIRAHELMKKLQGLLNRWKENDKNTARVDQGEVENQRAQQETIIEPQSGERLTQIKSYWIDLTKWSEEGNKRTYRIISMLQKIERVLIKLPASHKAKMQPMYSCLYAEADTFMDNMMDRTVRIHGDKKPRRSNVHCHELATPSQPLP